MRKKNGSSFVSGLRHEKVREVYGSYWDVRRVRKGAMALQGPGALCGQLKLPITKSIKVEKKRHKKVRYYERLYYPAG